MESQVIPGAQSQVLTVIIVIELQHTPHHAIPGKSARQNLQGWLFASFQNRYYISMQDFTADDF
jgi:hypothetical protein